MIDEFHGGSITPIEEEKAEETVQKVELPQEPQVSVSPVEEAPEVVAPSPEAVSLPEPPAPLPEPPAPLPEAPVEAAAVSPEPVEPFTPMAPIVPVEEPMVPTAEGVTANVQATQMPAAEPISEPAPKQEPESAIPEVVPQPVMEEEAPQTVEEPVAMVESVQKTPVEPVMEHPVEPEPVPVVEVVEVEEDVEAQSRDQQATVEELTEAAFEAAMQLVAAGHSVEQILGTDNFSRLPENIKQQIRGRLQQAAAQREMQQHEMAKETREKAQEKGGIAKLFSLAALGSIISKGTLEKINALFAQQPHLQQQIQMQGQALLKAGAKPDVEFAKSNVQIAGAAPSTPSVAQGQEQQR